MFIFMYANIIFNNSQKQGLKINLLKLIMSKSFFPIWILNNSLMNHHNDYINYILIVMFCHQSK